MPLKELPFVTMQMITFLLSSICAYFENCSPGGSKTSINKFNIGLIKFFLVLLWVIVGYRALLPNGTWVKYRRTYSADIFAIHKRILSRHMIVKMAASLEPFHACQQTAAFSNF